MSSTCRKKNPPNRCRLSKPLEDVRLLICHFLSDETLNYVNGDYCEVESRPGAGTVFRVVLPDQGDPGASKKGQRVHDN